MMPGLCLSGYNIHISQPKAQEKKTQPTPQSSHLHPLMMPGLCLSGYNVHISQPKAQEKKDTTNTTIISSSPSYDAWLASFWIQ